MSVAWRTRSLASEYVPAFMTDEPLLQLAIGAQEHSLAANCRSIPRLAVGFWVSRSCAFKSAVPSIALVPSLARAGLWNTCQQRVNFSLAVAKREIFFV